MIVETESMSISEILTTLNSLSQNVGSLATDVKILTSDMKSFRWTIGIGIAVVAIIVTLSKLL